MENNKNEINKDKKSNIINQINKKMLPNIIKIKNYHINKKNSYSNRKNKSIGQMTLEYKRKIKNNKSEIHNKFYKLYNSINDTLDFVESSKNYRLKFEKINLKTLFSPKLLEEIKRDKYNKKWNIKESYNKINKSKSFYNQKLKTQEKTKISEKYNYSNKEILFLNKIIAPKRLLPPKEIVKICKKKLYNNNNLMKYSLYLNNNIDYYIESQEQNSGFYDFDKQLRNMIKESKVGIEFPGNSLKRNVLTYIKTINPKSIISKHTKNYSVPVKTYIPIPESLIGTNFTHITIGDEYSYRKIIY